jgi:ABC-type lipoprotein export system ATPase subunit
MGDTLVELRNVSKFYNGTENISIFERINLDIQLGKIYIIFGPSGSGKTTLLNIIGLLDKPTEGEVIFCGERVDNLPENELTIRRIGKISYVFQDIRLIPTLSVLENIMLPTYFIKNKIDNNYLEYLLNFLNLSNKAKSLPSQLSGGQAQRVAIIRALITKPLLLLADEPTANLDRENRNKIKNLFVEYCKKNKATIVIATHDLGLIDIGDEILCILDRCLKSGKECISYDRHT